MEQRFWSMFGKGQREDRNAWRVEDEADEEGLEAGGEGDDM